MQTSMEKIPIEYEHEFHYYYSSWFLVSLDNISVPQQADIQRTDQIVE